MYKRRISLPPKLQHSTKIPSESAPVPSKVPSVIYIAREIGPDLIPINNACPNLNLLFQRNREKRKRLLQYSNTTLEQHRNENGIFCHHANYQWEGETEDREEGWQQTWPWMSGWKCHGKGTMKFCSKCFAFTFLPVLGLDNEPRLALVHTVVSHTEAIGHSSLCLNRRTNVDSPIAMALMMPLRMPESKSTAKLALLLRATHHP